jgi:hypothetical protein
MGIASAIGTQITNVELPAPQIERGLPIQASNLVVPPDGLALIVATDDDPENVQLPPAEPPTPPVSLTQFSEGSTTGDAPALSLLWFDTDGRLLLASIKMGPRVSTSDREALAELVPIDPTRSLGLTGLALTKMTTRPGAQGLPQSGVRRALSAIERVADRLLEGEEAVLHVMGWVGGRVGPPISVTHRLIRSKIAVLH